MSTRASSPGSVPVEPKPAASVVLVRPAPPGASEAIEVYMIRRQRSMKFLGVFYAFPGGKVDPADGAPAPRARGPRATALHRGDIGRVLDPPESRLPALPGRRDANGRARGVRSGLGRPVPLDRGALGGPRRRPSQVRRDHRPPRRLLGELRLEGQSLSGVSEHTTTVQVRWGDVDAAGIVFYPRFFEWYDLGCEALFASLGLAWPEAFPKYEIVGVPIVESGSRFVSPARYGDVLAIRSRVAWVRATTFRVEHEISVGSRLCATGFEVRAWVARPEAAGEPLHATPIPDDVVKRLTGA